MIHWQDIIKEFVSLWVVIDPIGTIPVFIAATIGLSATVQRKIALKATLIASLTLIGFVAFGQLLLGAMGISLAAFQIAGGVVLFLFALTMIFGDGKPGEEKKQITDSDAYQLAVYPIAIPSLASPGAMLAVVMQTDNHIYSLKEQLVTTSIVICILLISLVLLCLSKAVQNLIGDGGASVISRVMGLILASVAVDNVLSALTMYFGLALV
ncbi:MarC family protein [Agaribacterium sp. ZY112]|uniref:MarC family protein n=1 Tax=Agaribacterium sp. ZY112 TaxID=3233574 RepID=UPI00352585E2